VLLERLTIRQAASAPESLAFILVGLSVVLPCILANTVYAYSVFWGKVRELSYYRQRQRWPFASRAILPPLSRIRRQCMTNKDFDFHSVIASWR